MVSVEELQEDVFYSDERRDSEQQLVIRVKPYRRPCFELSIAISASSTCADLLDSIVECTSELGWCDRNSKWMLLEQWMGAERRIPPRKSIYSIVSTLQLVARQKPYASAKQSKPLDTDADSIRLLYKELKAKQEELQSLRWTRISKALPTDSNRDGLQSIASLNRALDKLCKQNEERAREVTQMNHEATRLTEHLTGLRKTSQAQSDSFSQIKSEADSKCKEQSKAKEERLTKLRQSILQAEQDLEKRQRTSELEDSKIRQIREEITSLHSTQKQLQQELHQMKEWARERKQIQDAEVPISLTDSGVFAMRGLSVKSSNTERSSHHQVKELNAVHVAPYITTLANENALSGASVSSFDSVSSYGSQKDYMRIRKRKNALDPKLQVVEEGMAFRQAHFNTKKFENDQALDENAIETRSDSISGENRVPTLLRSNSTKARSILRRSGSLKQQKARVRFPPEAIILSAAWDGDFTVLQQCISELGGRHINSFKGATCLHNAVCSHNTAVMQYLIELGYDVNARDCEGWTPLHCAVAYNDLSATQLLIQNGSSMHLQTVEGQTSLDISKEAAAMLAARNDAQPLCYMYLLDFNSQIGVLNGGLVYSLFSYTAKDSDEMSFTEGEKLTVVKRNDNGWWETEKAQGTRGLIPANYVGLYPPRQVVL